MENCGLKKAPDGLENCTTLEQLALKDNGSIGENPFSVSQLKKLTYLDMKNCGLKKAPDGLANCTTLEKLALKDNGSIGENPFSVSHGEES